MSRVAGEVDVDVVIPVHRADRDIEAALRSIDPALQKVRSRAIVVLHDVQLETGRLQEIESVATVVRCEDGIKSPSGPRNRGLEAAKAPWVFFLDSDDELAPRCLQRLVQVAAKTGVDVVLPSIAQGNRYIGTPFVASRQPRVLNAARDGLFERSHSFALIRREAMIAAGLRFPPGIRTGQDLVLMAQIYTTLSVSHAFDAVYRLKDHPDERVSTSPMPVADQVAAVNAIASSAWLPSLPRATRKALVHRLLAGNLANGWRRRREAGHEPSAPLHAELRDRLKQMEPGVYDLLSVRDRATLRFREPAGAVDRVLMSRFFGLVPASPAGVFSRHGPLVERIRQFLVHARRRRA